MSLYDLLFVLSPSTDLTRVALATQYRQVSWEEAFQAEPCHLARRARIVWAWRVDGLAFRPCLRTLAPKPTLQVHYGFAY